MSWRRPKTTMWRKCTKMTRRSTSRYSAERTRVPATAFSQLLRVTDREKQRTPHTGEHRGLRVNSRKTINLRRRSKCECTGQCGGDHDRTIEGRCCAPHGETVYRSVQFPYLWRATYAPDTYATLVQLNAIRVDSARHVVMCQHCAAAYHAARVRDERRANEEDHT